RVRHGACILLANSVDRPFDLRFGDLRRRAADAEPAARVDHQQTAVGVFEHVGGMKVLVVRDEKVLALDLEAGAVAFDDVPLNAAAVELRGKEIVAIFSPESLAAITHESRGGDPAEVGGGGQ